MSDRCEISRFSKITEGRLSGCTWERLLDAFGAEDGQFQRF